MGRESRQQFIFSRNFYRDHYRISVLLILAVNIFSVVLLVLSAYFNSVRPEPRYFATSSIGALSPVTPIVDPQRWVKPSQKN